MATHKQTYTRVLQCSHASVHVGLTQARPNLLQQVTNAENSSHLMSKEAPEFYVSYSGLSFPRLHAFRPTVHGTTLELLASK